MGNRFEKKRNEVKDVKEVGERIKIDRTTLKDEYAVMASIDAVMSEIDDEITNAINEVKAVGEREGTRLEGENQENITEKGKVANEISDEIGKLEKGKASLEAMSEFSFGKKSVEQAKNDYKEQTDKYEQLLSELESLYGSNYVNDHREFPAKWANDMDATFTLEEKASGGIFRLDEFYFEMRME